MVVYLFGAVALFLALGWAVYVLPVPGALSPWAVAGALVPALGLMVGVLVLFLLLWLALRAAEVLRARLLARKRR